MCLLWVIWRKITTIYWEWTDVLLTHCSLLIPYGNIDICLGWGNGLLSDGTKPLPKPMLTYHPWGSLAFSWGQVHRNGSKYHSLQNSWMLNIWKWCSISQEPISWGSRLDILRVSFTMVGISSSPTTTCSSPVWPWLGTPDNNLPPLLYQLSEVPDGWSGWWAKKKSDSSRLGRSNEVNMCVCLHDDIRTWMHFPHYWLFVRDPLVSSGFPSVDSPHRQSFDVFFLVSLNKFFNKKMSCQWYGCLNAHVISLWSWFLSNDQAMLYKTAVGNWCENVLKCMTFVDLLELILT